MSCRKKKAVFSALWRRPAAVAIRAALLSVVFQAALAAVCTVTRWGGGELIQVKGGAIEFYHNTLQAFGRSMGPTSDHQDN